MWYVIQTVSGDEHKLRDLLGHMGDSDAYSKCFSPVYEEVRRRADSYRITLRRLFPGYLFVETDRPEEVFRMLKSIPEFTRLLGTERDEDDRSFLPIGAEDEAFLKSILDDGVLHVSYVTLSRSHRIEKVVGPLAGYRNHIVKLEFRRREAVVETEMFGKRHRIHFGLWTDGDPAVPWLERQLGREQTPALDEGVALDIGINPGDAIIDETGLYGDQIFIVESVDAAHRRVYATLEMIGTRARVEMSADGVRKVEV